MCFTSIPLFKPGFHIVVNDGYASQSVDRRCCWDAYDDMGTFYGNVADVPVEIRKVQLSCSVVVRRVVMLCSSNDRNILEYASRTRFRGEGNSTYTNADKKPKEGSKS